MGKNIQIMKVFARLCSDSKEKILWNIIRRMESFQKETGHKGGVQVSIVTTYGLHENMYSEISPVPITMDELFG